MEQYPLFYLLISAFGLTFILGTEIDGNVGGFFASVSATTYVATNTAAAVATATPIFHNAMPPNTAAGTAKSPVRSDLFTGLFFTKSEHIR